MRRMKNIFDLGGLQEMLYVVVILMISLAIYPLVTWNIFFKGLITQIREQMCLETHFQYENSTLGCFGQRKNIQTAILVFYF